MLSLAKNLAFSLPCEDEILRLCLRMTSGTDPIVIEVK